MNTNFWPLTLLLEMDGVVGKLDGVVVDGVVKCALFPMSSSYMLHASSLLFAQLLAASRIKLTYINSICSS